MQANCNLCDRCNCGTVGSAAEVCTADVTSAAAMLKAEAAFTNAMQDDLDILTFPSFGL
jgi:hypothetical protein